MLYTSCQVHYGHCTRSDLNMLCKWGLQFGGTHADPRHHPTELAERRVRMAVGLKRYFHGKRLEGLLSSRVRALAG